MKKLLTFGAISIAVCMFFSSCSSNMSIAKRHYRGGYYVESVRRTQTANPVKKDERKTVQAKIKMPVYQTPQPSTSKYTTIDGHFNRVSPTGKIVTAAADEKVEHKIILQQTAKQMLKQTINITGNPFLQTKEVFSSAAQYHDDDAAGAALSLLWIVIVVVLIIWLIGILGGRFGLGGFINILLVIALILLILWLLRIA